MDPNGNGRGELAEMSERLAFMADGNERKLHEMVEFWFSLHDLNGDKEIDFAEFSHAFKERLDHPSRYQREGAPEQIHISLTAKPSEVVIVWVTFESDNQTSSTFLEYGPEPGQYITALQPQSYSYDAGFFGWEGTLHKVRLTGLTPSTTYHYRVNDKLSNTSPEFSFQTAPGRLVEGMRYLIFGDMGTFMPFGLVVTDAMVRDHLALNYDIAVHLGDISYAGTGSTREWQIVWDIWGRQVEPLAARMPYMTTLGNHEKYYNFTAFKARLPMQGEESGGVENYYYSFDFGGVHFVQTCSEDYAAPYIPGSQQYSWLEKDLQKAVENRANVPWIIVTGHRPLYGSSDEGGWDGIRTALEPLLKKYNVDVFLSGHIHAYERTFPVYNYETEIPSNPNIYTNPKHPVHVQVGTAGAFVWEKWVRPQPEWSAFRLARYGYANFELVNRTTLHFQFFSGHVLGEGVLSDEFYIVKE